jgi:hypothetical protein
MHAVKLVTIVGALALVGSAIQAGDEKSSSPKPPQNSTSNPACTPVPCVEFSQAIDAWRLANLAGEDKLAGEAEQRLMGLIDRDLNWCASQLEEYHNANNPGNATTPQATPTTTASHELQGTDDTYGWEMFGAKKRIAWNIRHTDAFSNKYRLLGDYEDLIKREKSADRAGVPLDMHEKGDNTLREAGK